MNLETAKTLLKARAQTAVDDSAKATIIVLLEILRLLEQEANQ